MIEMNEASERVFDAAEKLFHERGYSAVSMRDIARALDMRQASLYYHAPGGKEQLFVEITERALLYHRQGLDSVISQTEPNFKARLVAAANWLVGHAPIKLLAMLETDMPVISPDEAKRLTDLAFDCFILPLTRLFDEAIEKGEMRSFDPVQLAGYFLAMVDGISYTATTNRTPVPMAVSAEEMADLFFNGIRCA